MTNPSCNRRASSSPPSSPPSSNGRAEIVRTAERARNRGGVYNRGVSWRIEDHTADVRLRVEAADWPSLLEEAARAFAAYLYGERLPSPRSSVERSIEVAGDDRAECWVRWWRALFRLYAVEGLLALDVDARASEDATRVRATARCVPLDRLPAPADVDVKAVTWHDAVVREDGASGLAGEIILDV